MRNDCLVGLDFFLPHYLYENAKFGKIFLVELLAGAGDDEQDVVGLHPAQRLVQGAAHTASRLVQYSK